MRNQLALKRMHMRAARRAVAEPTRLNASDETAIAMFFVLSPPLIAVIYGNLHFHLLKLWGALSPARLPATIAGVPASNHLVASFIIDLGLLEEAEGKVWAELERAGYLDGF